MTIAPLIVFSVNVHSLDAAAIIGKIGVALVIFDYFGQPCYAHSCRVCSGFWLPIPAGLSVGYSHSVDL